MFEEDKAKEKPAATAAVMTEDMAREEILAWLKKKGVKNRKIEAQTEHKTIDALVEAIMEGELIVGDDGNLHQILSQPLDPQDAESKKLIYKPRLKLGKMRRIQESMGASPKDMTAGMLAYVAAATDTPVKLLDEMDSKDWGLASTISIFFM
jgi:lambda repressor-like predicted transcriptional regulator